MKTDAAALRLEKAEREDKELSEKLVAACAAFRSEFFEAFKTFRQENYSHRIEHLTWRAHLGLWSSDRFASGILNDLSKSIEKRTARARKILADIEKALALNKGTAPSDGDEICTRCGGTGEWRSYEGVDGVCYGCGGTGRRRRAPDS